jgi:[CysO sulfur-carrier protein]-thiocarboxylate-dependent cysteine synthase
LSSGAAMAGAARCAAQLPDGEQAAIVVVSADGGWKYLSTGAWTGDIDDVAERARSTVYF